MAVSGHEWVGEAASNWRDNTASQNMFLNIFFVHHNSTAAAEHGSDFRNPRRAIVNFLSVEWTPSRPKRSASMLRKTMIVLAKAAAFTRGLNVEAFAHGDAEGMRGPRCGWLRVKLVAPTSQAAALFYGRLFEVGQIWTCIEYLWLTAQQVIRRLPGLATRRASPVR
jgi:hypothetical protein